MISARDNLSPATPACDGQPLATPACDGLPLTSATLARDGLLSVACVHDSLTPVVLARLVEGVLPAVACDLRPDVRAALERAVRVETGARGRLVLGQLLENAQIAVQQRVPLCQDTGSVWVLLEVGERDAAGHKIAIPSDIFSLVDQAVARAYDAARLRKSLVCDALTDRANTGDNTPAFCELYLNPHLTGAILHIMLKGGGSDNASRVVMLPPGAGSAGVRDVVLDAVREKGESACPPLIVGVGVGSTFDKVGGLAKRALLRSLDEPNPSAELAAFEQGLLADINALGLGPGGFGGDTTALAVHALTAPCHIASLPVAVNIGCNSLRSVSIELDGGAAVGDAPGIGAVVGDASGDGAVADGTSAGGTP